MTVLRPLDANCDIRSLASTSAYTHDDDFDVDIFEGASSRSLLWWSGSSDTLSITEGHDVLDDQARATEEQLLALERQQLARDVRRRREEDERRQKEDHRIVRWADEGAEHTESAAVKSIKGKEKAVVGRKTKKRQSGTAANAHGNGDLEAAERIGRKASVALDIETERIIADAGERRREVDVTTVKRKRKRGAESKLQAPKKRKTSEITFASGDLREAGDVMPQYSQHMNFAEGVFSRNIAAFAFVEGAPPTSPEPVVDRPLQLPPSNQSVKRHTTGALLPPVTPVKARSKPSKRREEDVMHLPRMGVQSIRDSIAPLKPLTTANADSTDSGFDSTDSLLRGVGLLPKAIVYQAGEKPVLPDELKVTLRGLQRCPLCGLENWPKLAVDKSGQVVQRTRRKRSAKMIVVGGPARVQHVQMCALQTQTAVQTVLDLVERDQIPKHTSARLPSAKPNKQRDAPSFRQEEVVARDPPRLKIAAIASIVAPVTISLPNAPPKVPNGEGLDDGFHSTDTLLSIMSDAVAPRRIAYPAGEKPTFSEALRPTLRDLDRCPVCAHESWPTLNIDERGQVSYVVKKNRRKKPVKAVAVAGPARMLHLKMCALQSQTPVDTVLDLIKRDTVAMHRNRRREHVEAQAKASTWKSLVGEAPPCTQIQLQAAQNRAKGVHEVFIGRCVSVGMQYQRRGRPIPLLKANSTLASQQVTRINVIKRDATKKTKDAPMKRTGVHGGIDRATTTIVAPIWVRSAARRRAAVAERRPQDILEQYDLTDQAHEMPFATARGQRRGLGVGVCCAPEDVNDPLKFFTAMARLSRGNIMGASMERAIRGEKRSA